MTDISERPFSEAPGADDAAWRALLEWRRNGADGAPAADTPLHTLYAPLCRAHRNGTFAIGHLAQSLDGRIATTNGVSQWLSGDEDLLHTHRMRALADAVVVGVNTVLHDDPQLTVRRCAGANPVRVLIDPERRLDGTQRVFRDGAAATLLVVAEDRGRTGEAFGRAEVVTVARSEWGLDPREIRRVLAARGLTWLLVEGGGVTVSRFISAGALDRLQLTVAPVLLGSGRPSLKLPELSDLTNSLRPRTRRFVLGNDIMVECDFSD